METIDFVKASPALYSARGQTVAEVEVGPATFLALEGDGPPDAPAHVDAIRRLMELAWALRHALLYNGELDYRVAPLECLWLSDPTLAPHAPWVWRLMVRIPDAVTAARLEGPRRFLAARQGLATDDIQRIRFTEGTSLQTLHVGPYGEEAAAYARLDAHAGAHGLRLRGAGHDIYLNDPDRVAAPKLRTLIRVPAGRKRGG